MPKPEQDFRGVSLKRELVDQVEEFIEQNPQYKSTADFVHEAVRIRMEEIRKSYAVLPRFEHFNINSDGVRISDLKLNMIADIYIKPTGIFCELEFQESKKSFGNT